MNEVIKAILDRRSNRGFSDKPLTQAEVDTLAQVALASPTAVNRQNWHFSFVTNRALLKKYNRAMTDYMHKKSAGERGRFEDDGYDVFYRAPLVVIISCPVEASRFDQVDCGIAAENLAIAAQGMGMGSVIVGMVKEHFMSEEGRAWNREFAIPEGYAFGISVAIGHDPLDKGPHPIGEGKISFIG